jgi:hypothetical protein
MGEMRNAYIILVLDGDNNKKDVKEVGCDCGTAFIWLRTGSGSGLLWTLMNLLAP